MIKNLISHSFIILGCIILCLQEAKAEKTNLNNVYIGGHIGYLTTDTKYRIFGTGEYGGENNLKLSGHGINGGIHTGFGCFHGQNFPIYLGLEALAAFSNMETKEARTILNSISGGITKLKLKHSFGAAIRIGTYVTKAMPYVKTGIMVSRWEFMSALDPTLDPAANAYTKTNKYLPGLLLSLGIDIPLNEKVVLGLEGTHCHYKGLNLLHLNASPAFPVNKNLYYKVNPQINILQIRLSLRI